MSIIAEVIRLEADQTLSFGDYISKDKKKAENFEAQGDLYKVKTHNLVTRLEKNGGLLLETVPGAAIFNFKAAENVLTFSAAGFENTNITTELESETEYRIFVDNESIGQMCSNVGGKITFSVELSEAPQNVKIEKA